MVMARPDPPPPTPDPDDFICITIRWSDSRPVYDLGGWDEWAAIQVLREVAYKVRSKLLGPVEDGDPDDEDEDDDND